MVKYILILVLCTYTYATSLTTEFLRMSEKQKEALVVAYDQGGYTLAAIAWQESHAGNFRVGLNSNGSVDLGLFHINSESFLSRWYKEHPKKKRTPFYDNILLSKITVDDVYASKYANKELIYWRVQRKRSLKDAIKSYNCGTNINREVCNSYFTNILSKRLCLINHLQVGMDWKRK